MNALWYINTHTTPTFIFHINLDKKEKKKKRKLVPSLQWITHTVYPSFIVWVSPLHPPPPSLSISEGKSFWEWLKLLCCGYVWLLIAFVGYCGNEGVFALVCLSLFAILIPPPSPVCSPFVFPLSSFICFSSTFTSTPSCSVPLYVLYLFPPFSLSLLSSHPPISPPAPPPVFFFTCVPVSAFFSSLPSLFFIFSSLTIIFLFLTNLLSSSYFTYFSFSI